MMYYVRVFRFAYFFCLTEESNLEKPSLEKVSWMSSSLNCRSFLETRDLSRYELYVTPSYNFFYRNKEIVFIENVFFFMKKKLGAYNYCFSFKHTECKSYHCCNNYAFSKMHFWISSLVWCHKHSHLNCSITLG